MSEHDLDFETLKKEASEKSRRNDELLAQINAIDARLKQISDLKIQIINYVKTKDVYQEYHKHGNSRSLPPSMNRNWQCTRRQNRLSTHWV